MKGKRFIAACLAYTMLFGMIAELPPLNTSLSVMTASAEDAVEGTYEEVFSYKAYDDYVIITKYSGNDAEVSVPATINGIPVTKIGKYAFVNCSELQKIELSSGIVSIDEGAFYNCSSLTDVTFPKSLTELGDAAFGGCTALQKFSVASGNTAFSVSDGILYDASRTKLLVYPAGRTDTEFIIPDSVTAIGNGAFLGCAYLASVVMPDTVETTGDGVFGNCTALEKVVLSNQITSLPYLYLYNRVSDWVGYFENCYNLKEITLPEQLHVIGAYAFSRCDGLKSFIIPDTVTQVDIGAFSYCVNLTSITLGKNMTSYSSNFIEGNQRLASILVANENSSFSSTDGVLFNADGTTLLLYPSGKKDITYNVPEGTVTIGASAFENHSYLETVSLPKSLLTIENFAFYDVETLSSVKYSSEFIHNGNIGSSAFYGTAYLNAMEADENDLVISPERILFSVSDAETLTIPASVELVAGGAFKCESLFSVQFAGDCHISTHAFFKYPNLETITVKGNCVLENEAFYSWSGGSLKELSVEGTIQSKGNLPSSLETLIYSRTPLEYIFSEREEENTINVAESRTVSADTVYYSTYSNSTGYNNGFWSVDTLQEIMDSTGAIYAVCGYKDAVTLIPYTAETASVVIEKEGFTFGAATIDEKDNLYIMWGQNISDDELEEKMESENIVFSKYDMQGNLIAECGLAVEQTRAQFPFDAGNANILVKDNILGCLFNTEWTKSSDGLHHQGAEFAAINIETMELTLFDSWQGSHSFGVSMIPTEYGFAAIHMGDGPRGFLFNTYFVENSICEESYLKSNGYYLLYHASGKYGTNANKLDGNTTYLHMGGLAESSSTYAVAGKSEQVMTSDIYYESGLRTGIYDVFVKLTDKTLCSTVTGLAGVDRIDEATGEAVDHNVVWLTKCNETEKAGQVKLVTMEDGSYCVLWEKFVDGKFDSVRYVILDECGNILRSETEIKNARLSNTSIQPIIQGSTLIWAVADENIDGVTWYSVDLEVFEDFSERFTGVEELAKEHDLEFTLNEGYYGMCGEDVYWAYLKESNSLLIAGTGTMQYMDNPPWVDFTSDITNVFIGDGITSIHNNAFNNCAVLTSAELPETITEIGTHAFSDCSALTEIVIPDAVTQLGSYAFSGCSTLTEIVIPDAVTQLGSYAFSRCILLEQVVLPSKITKIPNNMFYRCSSLTEVVIPDTVTKIETYAFSGCSALTKIVIPDAVTEIGSYAFNECSKLTLLCIPQSVSTIEEHAFYDCTRLKSVILLNSETEIGDKALGYYGSYYSEDKLISDFTLYGFAESTAETYASENEFDFVRIDGICGKNAAWQFDAKTGTLYISGNGAIEDFTDSEQPWTDYMTEITFVEIADSITSIGANAFAGAENLEYIILNSTITEIGSGAFDADCILYGYADSVAETYAKENTLTFKQIHGRCGERAVWYFDTQTAKLSVMGSGSIPDYTNSISVPWYDFKEDIISVTIEKGITSVGAYAFYYCEAVQTVSFPDTVVQIGDYAFYGCKSLTSVRIPETVTHIGDSAFCYCPNLKNIILLNSKTEIAEQAIGYTPYDSTYSVTLYSYDGSSAETYAKENELNFVSIDGMCGESTLWCFNAETGILYLHGVGATEDFTPEQQPWAEYLPVITSVVISDSITSIGANAFANAENLTSIILDETITAIGSNAFDTTCKIYGYAGSAADSYAKENQLTFMEINGKCGEQAVWFYDEKLHALSIMGSGAMTDYSYNGDVPWYDFREEITSVSIAKGITSVGSRAFYYCESLTSIELPATITRIGEYAFYECDTLTSIRIPESVTLIEDSAFCYCPNLKNIILLNSQTEIAEYSIGYYYTSYSYYGITLYGYANSSAETYAEENEFNFIPIDGICGESALWRFDAETGILYLYGIGAMEDFTPEQQPWAEYLPMITSVIICDGITSIGANAFANAENLTSIILDETITVIGSHAFDNTCTIYGYAGSVADSYAEENQLTFVKINGKCGEQVVWFYNEELHTLSVMGGGAMTDYSYNSDVPWYDFREEITSVSIAKGITSVGSRAFYYCESLTSIELPATITRIGEYAFYECDTLTSIRIPESVTLIEDSAFCYCPNLKNIILLNSQTEIAEYSIGYYYTSYSYYGITLYGYANSSAETYAEENEFNFIPIDGMCGESALWRFDAETGILHLYGIGAMEDFTPEQQPWAEYLPMITSVVISDGITSIGANAFVNAENLTSIILDETVTAIGSHAFDNTCTIYGYAGSVADSYAKENKLTFVEINGKCGEQAVWLYDEELHALSIMGSGIMTDYSYGSDVPWYDFREEITSVNIAEGITSVGSYAFYYCEALTSIELPATITRIGEYAFYECDTLTSICIPESVTCIEDSAFRYCSNLKNIILLNLKTEITEKAIGYYSSTIISGVVLYGHTDSTAEAYAEENGFTFINLNTLITSVSVEVGILDGEEKVADVALRISEIYEEEILEFASWTSSADGTKIIDDIKTEQVYVLENTTAPDGYLAAEPIYFYFDKFGTCYTSMDGDNWLETKTTVLTMEIVKIKSNVIVQNSNENLSGIQMTVTCTDEEQIFDSWMAYDDERHEIERLTAGKVYEIQGIPLDMEGKKLEKYKVSARFYVSDEDGNTYLFTEGENGESIYVLSENGIIIMIPEITIETTTTTPETTTTTTTMIPETTTTTTTTIPETTTTTTTTIPETTTTTTTTIPETATTTTTTIPETTTTTTTTTPETTTTTTTTIPETTTTTTTTTPETTTTTTTTMPETSTTTTTTILETTTTTTTTMPETTTTTINPIPETATMTTTTQATTTITFITSETTTTEIDIIVEFELGDVNGDGSINASDAAEILREAALIGAGYEGEFTEKQSVVADVNSDGAVNAVDASVILIYATMIGAGNNVTIEELVLLYLAM